jgi:archaemetzincin
VNRPIFLAYLNGYSPRWTGTVAQGVERGLGQPVSRLDLALDLTPFYAAERRQYHATLLLAALLRHLPDPNGKIIGLTSVDLFIPVLTFVFGQSQLDGPAAVASTYRLHSEFYGLPANEAALRDRIVKEALHELGHAFGLVHCRDPRCVMRASTYVEEVDLKDAEFCRECGERLAAGSQ